MRLTDDELKLIISQLESAYYKYSDAITNLKDEIKEIKKRNYRPEYINQKKQELAEYRNNYKLVERLDKKISREQFRRGLNNNHEKL